MAARALYRVMSRVVSATAIVGRDSRIPRPLRWIVGIGLLPIPGPGDEMVLLLAAPVLLISYRGSMREAWARAQEPGELEASHAYPVPAEEYV